MFNSIFDELKELKNFQQMQLNSCHSNSRNSKDRLNRANTSIPSEFTSKPYKKTPLIRTHIILKII